MMKMSLAVFVLCTFAQNALARELDCRAIENTSGRLACYDAAFPPKIKAPVTVESDASRAAYKDPFTAEEARTAAKLKNICRGC
ncbi:type VI secretion system-associated protein TagO [Bradyrhizobium monzae]|uniref:type VI secretion system-associated protein TagO n=1 Tax=Bradyrhizobium sp. Oc8 TaxID=2876780 RepID=UPI001F4707EB|nr:type VI secretion system-associated protein TagO [Bradyrhizobium sp. Oc8]